MSRLTVTSIRDLQAIQRRLARVELMRLARMISKLSETEKALNQLEGVNADASERLSNRLAQLDESSTPTERSDLRIDIESDMERLDSEVQAARQRRVSLKLTAQSLLPSASDVQQQTICEVVQRSDRAKATEYRHLRKSIESIISDKVLNTENEKRSVPRSQAAEQLAKALMTPERSGALPQRAIDPRLERLIQTLAALGPQAVDLSERAAALVQQQGGNQYALSLDALLLDASEQAQRVRNQDNRSIRIEEAVDRLAPYDDPGSVEWRSRLQNCRRDQAESDEIVKGALLHANATDQALDAARARLEIIKGLEEMGYDVTLQGDEWNEGQRITASHRSDSNYDVQLSAVPGSKVQTKVRAHMHVGRTPEANLRDFEMEQKWCDDQNSLHDRLSAAQLDVLVERADPPVKGDVHLVESEGSEPTNVRRRGTKRLD